MRQRAFALAVLCVLALTLRDVARVGAARGAAGGRRVAEAAAVVAALGGPLRTLRGRVETEEHGALEGATLDAILVLEGRSYPIAQGWSAADGSFALGELPEGSYWLVARAPGRARRVEAVRIHGADPAALTLALGPGSTIAGSVALAPRRRDLDNEEPPTPLAGVVVRAAPDGGGQGPPFATRTDARGQFVLAGLPPGSYRVEVAHPGFEPVVRRAVPAPARGLALALRALATLAGVVRDAQGAPAPGAEVLLAGSGVWPPRATPVRPDGRFEIVSVPAGVYELRARRGDDEVAEPVAPLMLDPGDRREVTLTVTPGATLTGTVVDALTRHALPGARVVVAEDALATAPRAIVADAHGAFTATGLLRRPHQVSARAEGYVPRVGALATPGAAPVEVALDREVVLTGRVVDNRGTPVPGAQIEVNATDLDGRAAWLTASAIAFRDALFTAQARGPRPLIPAGELGVMPGPVPVVPLAQPGGGLPSNVFTGASATGAGYVTDAQGRFRINEVPPGVVRLSASHPAYVRGESTERAARAGETLEVEIVLHPGGTIDGRLVDERGYPVAGQAIEVRSERDPLPRRAFSARDGTFRVPAVLGPVAVVALVGGRVGARAEVVVDDDAVVPVTLTLDRGVRRVRGRVLDPRGFPVAGAELTIAVAGRPMGATRTLSTADGTFDTMVGASADAALAVEVRHPAFAQHTERVAPAAGDDVTITLDPGGTLALRVAADACAEGEIAVELRTPCGPIRRTLRAAGELSIEHLCAGRVTAIASAPGCVRGERRGAVVAGRDTDIGRIDLTAGGAAEGDVVDGRGDPVAGATVALANAPPDATTGTARTGRRGEFTVRDLPDGDHELVAEHPLLGRSAPAPVRVLRGTLARGVRLRFERDLGSAERVAASAPVAFVERGGHVEVARVQPDSAAARAGLQPGDQVVTAQGNAVNTAAEAGARLRGPAGDEVVLEVARDGARRTVRWVRELER